MPPRKKSFRVSKLNFRNQCAKKSPQWGSHVVRKSERISRRNSSCTVEDIPQWGSHIVHEPSPDSSSDSSVDPPSSSDEEHVRRKKICKSKNKISEIIAGQSIIYAQLPKNFRAPKELTQRDQLLWIQRNRTIYYWVKCSNLKCQKWRLLKYIIDPNDIANHWVCSMNQEEDYNSCESPQTASFCLRDLVDIKYNIGSIVMAKLPGYPWWPAMIDDDPEFGQFYWLNAEGSKNLHYHVIYFDKNVSRHWQTIEEILPFNNSSISMYDPLKKLYKKKITDSIALAKSASKMDIAERLEKFSFARKFVGPIYSYKYNLQEFVKKRNLPPYVDTDDENEGKPIEKRNKADIIESIVSQSKSQDDINRAIEFLRKNNYEQKKVENKNISFKEDENKEEVTICISSSDYEMENLQ